MLSISVQGLCGLWPETHAKFCAPSPLVLENKAKVHIFGQERDVSVHRLDMIHLRDNSLSRSGSSVDCLGLSAENLTDIEKATLEQDRLEFLFHKTCCWLDQYFAQQEPQLDIPLCLKGTAFEMRVWSLLKTIPYGTTTTYGTLAHKICEQLGREHMSAQAVGGAVGRNPISIIVPCHRVLGAQGQLTGYAGGLKLKQQLLQLEGVQI